MLRKVGLVVAGIAGISLVLGVATAQDGKSMTNKQVMKKVAGKTGLCAKCGASAKTGNWEEAQKLAKELKACGEALSKNKCPKGDAGSWEKLSKRYAEQTAAIAEAAEKKDSKAFQSAIGTFTKSCKGCHDAHKGK